MVKLSVIIPAYNEEGYISELLDTVESQNFSDYEVIVCDGGSEDRTREICREYGVKIVEDDGGGPGEARNRGASEAEGDILLFLDADVRLTNDDVFRKVVDCIENREENVVGGTSTWKVHDANLRAKVSYKISAKLLKVVNWLDLEPAAAGTFTFVRKDIFEKVNGFDETLPYHEDHDFMGRIDEYGETVLMEEEHSSSGRRVVENGLISSMITYFLPSLYYTLGREEEMKEKFEFETISSDKSEES